MSDEERPLLEHVEELIVRLRRSILAVIVAAVILSAVPVETTYYTPLITKFPQMLIEHTVPTHIEFMGKRYNMTIGQWKPFSGFNVLIKTAIILGILGALPVITREIYAYVAPALYPHEARALKKALTAGTALFMLGILVAYYVVVPIAFKMMAILFLAISPANIAQGMFSDISELYDAILMLLIATGLSFEFPLIIYYLISSGIMEPERFKGENMKYAFVAMLVVSAIISPDPTGMTMLLLAMPYFALYVAAVKLGERSYRKKRGEFSQASP